MDFPKDAIARLMDKNQRQVKIGFKENKDSNWALEVYDPPNSRSPKNTYDLTRTLSEIKQQDNGSSLLILITTTQEISFLFNNSGDAMPFHNTICKLSQVQQENKAISQLDDEMRGIWPFPGGSFF